MRSSGSPNLSNFKYKARNSSGDLIEGIVDLPTEIEAMQDIISRDLIPVSIEKEDAVTNLANVFLERRRVKIRDLSIFFKQLSVIVTAGVPLFEGLIAIEEQTSNQNLKRIIGIIRKDIEGGNSFSQSLAKYPDIFSKIIVAMVEAGEKGGVLGDILSRLSAYTEKEYNFQQKIKASLRYPMIVITVLLVAFIITVVFIIPKFSKMFRAMGSDLPLPTKILVWISNFVQSYWYIILVAVIAGGWGLSKYFKTPDGKARLDAVVLKIPVFGPLVKKLSLSRFFSMFSNLLTSGVPIVACIELTGRASNNTVIMDAISTIKNSVMEGNSLSSSMKAFSLFPAISVHMVSLGEKTGRLSDMLGKISDYFDEEADYMIANLMTLIEPLFVFVLAMFVMVLALGVFLPSWNMMNLYFKP